MKVAIVGLGHMGQALAKGLVRAPEDLTLLGYSSQAEKAQALGLTPVTELPALAAQAPDVVLLTVPAKVTTQVLADLVATDLPEKTLVLSAAAAIKNADLRFQAPKHALTTFIPNIPVAVNAGTIALAQDEGLPAQALVQARTLLARLGDVITVPADQIAIAGTIGGCSPAYIDVFMDALEDVAVAEGMDRAQARQVVASVVAGTAQLAQHSSLSFADLKGQITSPGGTTVRGLLALDEKGFRQAVHAAILAAVGHA
ncbi:pyrroline-5-carboxylate reductase dimerization domain-containing protein [Leuconostocaceae bacterium ESL0958]|nr:pyrroline-5-carboxylate reductase dimerization domain-containing protein [Leuconostocaceae bacterium ESL0958]